MTYPSESLIREALVREIRDAKRWQTIEEAWEALLTVRRMADERRAETLGSEDRLHRLS